jgi:hypothetical protein
MISQAEIGKKAVDSRHARGGLRIGHREHRRGIRAHGLILSLLLFGGTADLATGSITGATPQAANSTNTMPPPSVEKPTQDWHPQLILRVHNYAHVDAGFLHGAEEIARRILREAKVDAKWVDCPLPQEEDDRYPECPANLGTTAFVLNVLTPEMAGSIQTRGEALGYALTPCDEIATSCAINVLYFRVAELAARSNILPARLLGHVLAHELGHMLLGMNHSSKGIMRGAWGRNDLKVIGVGFLDFSSDQAEQMRATLLRRARQEEVAESVKLSARR